MNRVVVAIASVVAMPTLAACEDHSLVGAQGLSDASAEAAQSPPPMSDAGKQGTSTDDRTIGTKDGSPQADGAAESLTNWKTSYSAPSTDADGGLMEGTELRALVPFNGSMYAAIGYWEDTQGFAARGAPNPQLPGAQVLRLDGPETGWKIDMELDDVIPTGASAGQRATFAIAAMEALTMTTDSTGRTLSPPVELLAATTWAHTAGLHVYVRSADSASWVASVLGVGSGGTEGRAFATHVDSQTGISTAFTGSDDGIYRGRYDQGTSTLAWAPTPEAWFSSGGTSDAPPLNDGWRVMSFSDCDGSLYATIGPAIYQRQDGGTPTWKKVYTYPFANPTEQFLSGTGGLRGAYCLANTTGSGSVLLVAAEGVPNIVKVDPNADFAETVDMDVKTLLTTTWGFPVSGALLAYNHFTPATDPITQEKVLLIGFEASVGPSVQTSVPIFHTDRPDGGTGRMLATANYLVRHANGSYSVFSMEDPALASPPPRVSVRTLAVSPFPADRNAVVYAGGFDCNGTPVHNTAWALKGPLAIALGH